jgi:hypothetical protein
MNSNQSILEKYNTNFFLLASAGIASLIGGAYLLYSLICEDDVELDEEEIIEINNLQETVQTKGKMTSDVAVKIICLINSHTEEEMRKKHQQLLKTRREAVSNEVEYNELCRKTFEIKEEINNAVSNKILAQFGTTQEELEVVLRNTDPREIQEKMAESTKEPIDPNNRPNKEKTKEAFIFFGNKLFEQMQGMTNKMRMLQSRQDPMMEQMLMVSLMIEKTKVEDLLYIKYNISENQIKSLLEEHDLLNDYEVMNVYQKIASFENMMGP